MGPPAPHGNGGGGSGGSGRVVSMAALWSGALLPGCLPGLHSQFPQWGVGPVVPTATSPAPPPDSRARAPKRHLAAPRASSRGSPRSCPVTPLGWGGGSGALCGETCWGWPGRRSGARTEHLGRTFGFKGFDLEK